MQKVLLHPSRTINLSLIDLYFRKDGIGLRDDYKISGGELEAMCDIVRGVDGALGERMLGGGDAGAAGALVRTEAVARITKAIDNLFDSSTL